MRNRPSKHAHEMVAQVAAEAAEELYEVVMGDNKVRAEWKRQNPDADEKELVKRFVRRNKAKCLPFARATLARLLVTSTDEDLRARVTNALILDATLLRGRV